MTLAIGQKAPDFTLQRDGGGSVSLSDFAGKMAVVYFYPKASTSGCTVEAKDFSALMDQFKALNVPVVAISADPVKKLNNFRDKEALSIILAGDETHEVLTAYGVWVEKSMYGKTYMGIERTTFLLNANGTIAKIWPKVKIPGHAHEVLAAAKQLLQS